MNSFGTDAFWSEYRSLPKNIRDLTCKTYQLWVEDTKNHGLWFKKIKGQNQNIWEIRVGIHHRAVCVRDGNDCAWFWIGTKEEFSKRY